MEVVQTLVNALVIGAAGVILARMAHNLRQEVKSEIQLQDKKLQELLEKAKVDLNDKDKNEANADQEPKTPEELRRVAIKKLTSVSDNIVVARS